jgi:hypothetical protein
MRRPIRTMGRMRRNHRSPCYHWQGRQKRTTESCASHSHTSGTRSPASGSSRFVRSARRNHRRHIRKSASSPRLNILPKLYLKKPAGRRLPLGPKSNSPGFGRGCWLGLRIVAREAQSPATAASASVATFAAPLPLAGAIWTGFTGAPGTAIWICWIEPIWTTDSWGFFSTISS